MLCQRRSDFWLVAREEAVKEWKGLLKEGWKRVDQQW